MTDTNALLPAYLINGEDELKRETVLKRLHARIAKLGDIDFNHDVFHGESASGDDIVSACNTVPFASDVRLVVVHAADALKKSDAEALVTYLSEPSPSTVLCLVARKLAKNTRLYKAVAAVGKKAVIDCAPMKKYELPKTVRAMAVTHGITLDDGQKYQFNLIDTPGHVDFTYEVSRSLAACEGAVLVVDATQGVEAQTVANAMMAMNADLEIIPLINKIDLPAAEPERVKEEIEDGLAIPADDAILASGKTGAGIPDLLEAVVHMIPSPEGDPKAPLRALIFDSYFDAYRGVVALIRVVDGSIKKGDAVRLVNAKTEMQVEEVGARRPAEIALPELSVGEVGYLVTGLKDVSQVRVGDTITSKVGGVEEPLPGYREAKPMVYTGLFPIDGDQYEPLKEALEKLSLNDPALIWEAENSHALGFGFRVGFLGLLHMEVIKERLEREFGLDLIATAPSVEYHVYKTNGDMVSLHSPQDMPDPSHIDHVEEPYLKATIMIPPDYVGAVMDLTVAHRGTFKTMNYLSTTTVEMIWEIPSSELILDYFDQLKSRTKGYASLDYEYLGYKPGALQKLDILLSGKPIDALSFIVHKDKAYDRGRVLCEKLKEIIPQQMFEVPIQAAVGGRVLSRQTVRAKRKDVLAKCYGGDISRKRKLLEKQKAGKKRMKAIGNVEVPQEAFMAILKVDE